MPRAWRPEQVKRREARRLVVVMGGALVLAVAALMFVSGVLSPFFGDAPNRRSEIQANLVQAAQQAGEGGTVKFADIVPAAWDTVYIWDGYSADPGHVVFPGVDFGTGGYGSDDVVAFSDQGKLVAWVRYNVNQPAVVFEMPSGGIKATREAAVFKVVKDPAYPADYALILGQ